MTGGETSLKPLSKVIPSHILGPLLSSKRQLCQLVRDRKGQYFLPGPLCFKCPKLITKRSKNLCCIYKLPVFPTYNPFFALNLQKQITEMKWLVEIHKHKSFSLVTVTEVGYLEVFHYHVYIVDQFIQASTQTSRATWVSYNYCHSVMRTWGIKAHQMLHWTFLGRPLKHKPHSIANSWSGKSIFLKSSWCVFFETFA